jgi:4-amino-4-deoxy-L-arabinose transferase-like glycosyltransferase
MNFNANSDANNADPVTPRTFSPYLIAAAFCLLLSLTGIFLRPLFPVDETRYMTVAWEMFSHHDWLLPTLNFEPYHHKPPILFWLIMGLWSVFGVSQTVAMIAPYLIAFAVSCALIKLAQLLQPASKQIPLLAILLFTGSLPFALYSHLIMFDMLLSIFALLGLIAVWQFAQTGRWLYIGLFGIAVGLGVLAKGPVILLHTLPVVILARFWVARDTFQISWGRWALAFFLGTLLGAAIALSWAIPAAIRGGPEFTEKIFWGQTAGRVANSFDHQKPVWWYLPILPLLTLPWLIHAGAWKGFRTLLKDTAVTTSQQALRFLACWMVPAFVIFSLISGKQPHYLLPLVPGFILLCALSLDRIGAQTRFIYVLPALLVAALLTALPAIGIASLGFMPPALLEKAHLAETINSFSVPVSLAGCGVILILIILVRKAGLQLQLAAVAAAMLVFMSSFQVQAHRSFYRNYDLTPVSEIVMHYPDTPLAFVRNYHGEWGFLARLDRPVKQIDLHEIAPWFKEHPDGMAFIRTSRETEFAPYDVIFSMPYKMTATYAIIVPRGKGKNFSKH